MVLRSLKFGAGARRRFADSQSDLAACLDFLQEPERPDTSIRLTRLLIDRELPISDNLQERLLRAQLLHEPFRLDLTTSLIRLLLKRGRSPFPDVSPTGQSAPMTLESLLGLADDAAEAGRVIEQYAAVWQATIQYPASPRGPAEFAHALALRQSWRDARQAAKIAINMDAGSDVAATTASLAALNLMAEQKELADINCDAFLASLPAELKVCPEAVSLMVHRGDPDGFRLVPAMLRSSEGRWKTFLVAALAAHNCGDFETCYQHTRRAFEQNASETLREVTTIYSAQIDRAIREIGVADEFGAWLTEYSSSSPIDTLIYPSSEAEVRERTRGLRRKALERELPSVFLATYPKTASVSVGNIFSSGFALPTAVYSLVTQRVIAPWLAEYIRGGACYVTHLCPTLTNIDLLSVAKVPNVIVHVRDVRQLLVSWMEHNRKYPEQLPVEQRAIYAQDDDGASRAAVATYLPHVIAWLDGWVGARAKIKIDFTHFEDFVNSRERFIDRIVGLYGGDRKYFDREDAVTEHAGIDYHRRLGATDEWRRRLSREQVDLINAAIPSHFWQIFGWTP